MTPIRVFHDQPLRGAFPICHRVACFSSFRNQQKEKYVVMRRRVSKRWFFQGLEECDCTSVTTSCVLRHVGVGQPRSNSKRGVHVFGLVCLRCALCCSAANTHSGISQPFVIEAPRSITTSRHQRSICSYIDSSIHRFIHTSPKQAPDSQQQQQEQQQRDRGHHVHTGPQDDATQPDPAAQSGGLGRCPVALIMGTSHAAFWCHHSGKIRECR